MLQQERDTSHTRSTAPTAKQVLTGGGVAVPDLANLGNRAVVDGRDLWRDQTVGLLCRGCGSRGCAWRATKTIRDLPDGEPLELAVVSRQRDGPATLDNPIRSRG